MLGVDELLRAAYAGDPEKNQDIGAELQARRQASARYYAKYVLA